MKPKLSESQVHQILSATHNDPFSVLGRLPGDGCTVYRFFRPHTMQAFLFDAADPATEYEATRLHDEGLFEISVPGVGPEDYRWRIRDWRGEEQVLDDAYRFGRILSPLDEYLWCEGNHLEIYRKLGAHPATMGPIAGVHFAVWAPNAQRVSVVGDFNRWDGRIHPMRKLVGSGIWEIFIPGVGVGAHYKFELRDAHGGLVLKTDPFAFFAQHGLQTAALVYDIGRYVWNDAEWMESRKTADPQRQPVSIYEVHLGSWARVVEEGNRPLSYNELADRLLPYVKELGYTHIELLPVMEHPFDGSWGYQVTGFFAPTSRFGTPDEFRAFVDRCHREGIGVILDWVPGHFPKDAHGLARFDGTCLYEHADPRQGEHRDWGTLIFNYDRHEVRNFLIANALFWLEQYHIDGLRVDAVASMLYLDYSREPGDWIPNSHGGRENLGAIDFLRRLNEVCYGRFPGIMTIAEESTAWPMVSRPTWLGGLGFGFKWNMGWMNDSLRYMAKEPVHRRFHQGEITFSLLYAYHEHFVLVLSHDEVVHGKGSLLGRMPGDAWQKFANLRMFYGWMYGHPGRKLLFMGGEFAQGAEWNHARSLDWHLTELPPHDGVRRLVAHLNHLYRNEPALYDLDDSPEGFEWIDFQDADASVISFVRKSPKGPSLLFVVNATPVVREGYRVGAPGPGFYEEVLNTDAETYGGSNKGNYGGLYAEPVPWQNRSHSLPLTLPPLATVALKWHPA